MIREDAHGIILVSQKVLKKKSHWKQNLTGDI